MTGILLNPEREHENIPGQRSVDGEAYRAASVTFIAACDRVDKILADPERWGTAYQKALEQQYNDQHENAMAVSKAALEAEEQRKKAAEMLTSPQFRYKPLLVRLEGGGWGAFLGSTDDLDSGILGLGANPEAALANFDRAFRGQLDPKVAKWLKERESNIESGVETTTPFPKTPNAKSVDTVRDSGVEKPPGGGEEHPRDSECDRPNTGFD
jgi:hypothetical protein